MSNFLIKKNRLQTLKQGIFESMSTFDNINLPDGPPNIDMCLIESSTFDMLYVNDLNGNFRPSTMTTTSTGPATLIASDNNELLKFVDQRKCVYVSTGCYWYCRDTCFRSLRVDVVGPGQDNYKLKVCVQNVTPEKCTYYRAGRRSGTESTIMAHLPVTLRYTAVVVDSTLKVIVPTLQDPYFEENKCGTSTFAVSLVGQVGSIPFIPFT